MGKVATNITIDSEIKAKAQELFADFGMDLSTAINIFLRQTIRENAIPFSISRDVPNADTIAAMKECNEIAAYPEKYKKYSSFSELLEEVRADA